MSEEMAKGLVWVMGIGMGTTVAYDTSVPQKNEKDHSSLFQHKKKDIWRGLFHWKFPPQLQILKNVQNLLMAMLEGEKVFSFKYNP